MHHVTHHGIRSLTAGESENQSRTYSHTNQSTDECDDRRSVFAMQPIRGTPSRMLHLDTTCATSSGFPVGNASATDTTLPVLDHRSLPRSGNIAKRAGRILILLPGGDDARRAGRAIATVSADNTIVASDATGDEPIILVSSPFVEEPSTCVSSAAGSSEASSLLDGNGTACWSFSPDAFKTFLYTCVATAETTEPAATPITDPAIPIFAESRNDVTAASAPAQIDEKEIPLKKFSTSPDDS